MPRPLRRTGSAQGAVRESRWTRVTSLGLHAMPSGRVSGPSRIPSSGPSGQSLVRKTPDGP